jgi:molybdopterin/thiamine biosynthesis adenylyltransferase
MCCDFVDKWYLSELYSLLMNINYSELFSRNIGVISESEQEILHHSTVAIAGVGGVGGLLAERLVRLGVGRLKITDPGVFEKSNFNRQFGASMSSQNRNKAAVICTQLRDINPEAKIDYDSTGIITADDAYLFTADCDLVIDGMDFGCFKQSIWLQRAARHKGIYYLFAYSLGFGSMIVIFSPQGMTLEEYDNLPPDADINNEKEIQVPLERVMPVIPSYAAVSTHKALQDIYSGDRKAPSVSIGVGLASILAAVEALNIILRKRAIVTAPHYTYIDLLDQKFIVGKIP